MTPLNDQPVTVAPKIHVVFWVVIAACLLFAALAATNPLVSCGVIIAFALGVMLLWPVDPCRMLLFVFAYHWLQASVKVFQADFQNVPLEQLTSFGGQVDTATWLSLAAVVVLALGMRVAVATQVRMRVNIAALPDYLTSVTPRFWFRVYLFSLLIGLTAGEAAAAVPTLSQPLLALSGIKWTGFWIFAYFTFLRPDRQIDLFAIAFAIEMILGVGGFFSDFKTAFFVSFIAMLASNSRVTPVRGLSAVCALSLLIYMSLIWTAVKIDYRRFVGGESNTQAVEVGYQERIRFLHELVSKLEKQDMAEAVDAALARVSYVEFFGSVLDFVPSRVPYENGAIWLDAAIRPLTPRLFFPEKSSIEDSARTSNFTGLKLAGTDQGTSISIGYVGESYIDFGYFGMFFPLFFWGAMLGLASRYFINHARVGGAIGGALAVSVLLPQISMEASITKSFGGLVVSVLVTLLIARYVLPVGLKFLAREHTR
jgi:hypothetical protein